jgi:PilZ domain
MPERDDTEERRRFTRIPFDAHVGIRDVRGIWQGTLIDISIKGALVELPTDWPGQIGDAVRLEIRLGDGSVGITMETRLAHLDGRRGGFARTSTDLESFTALRRLLELNLGDEAALMRELSELG